jgi:hypothetical protein
LENHVTVIVGLDSSQQIKQASQERLCLAQQRFQKGSPVRFCTRETGAAPALKPRAARFGNLGVTLGSRIDIVLRPCAERMDQVEVLIPIPAAR